MSACSRYIVIVNVTVVLISGACRGDTVVVDFIVILHVCACRGDIVIVNVILTGLKTLLEVMSEKYRQYTGPISSNERLEFLGDAVLEFLTT